MCIQKSYLGEDILAYPVFVIEWRIVGKRREQGVMIGIAVRTEERLIVDPQKDIIDHPYIMSLDMWELYGKERKKKRRTRIVNNYDNNSRTDEVYENLRSNTKCKVLMGAERDRILGVERFSSVPSMYTSQSETYNTTEEEM